MAFTIRDYCKHCAEERWNSGAWHLAMAGRIVCL